MSDSTLKKQGQREMILNDNIWKIAVRLSWPAVLAMVLYGLNTVFDAIFVGKFVGETALAGISVVYPLSQISLGIGSLIGVGAGSALSIAIGAEDHDTQEKLLGNVNYLSVVISLVFMLVAWFAAPTLAKIMGGYGEILPFGVSYFRITVIGAFFWIIGLASNMIVRAEGKMKSAAAIMACGLVINIAANYVFIVIWKMGVEGAAWGTNLGMLIYTILGFFYFSSKRVSFDAKPFRFRRDKEITKSILSLGASSFIMSFMSVIQGLVVLNALSKFGTTMDIAFYGAAFRLFTFLLTPIFGFMRALQPVVGINYGAQYYERTIASVKVFSICAMVLMLPFWLVMMIDPTTVLSMMFSTTALTATDLSNFRIFMVLLPILPVIFMSMTFFPAINKGKPAAVMGIGRQLVFYVPVMLILPRLFGVNWVYIGSTGIDILVTLWTVMLLRKEFKILRKMNDGSLVESESPVTI